jgi:hypothetical protein
MILMAEAVISGSGDRDRGRGRGRGGGGGSDDGNSGNRDNSDGSSRTSMDWEVEQIRGMDSEEMMLAMVELGMGVKKISDMRGTVSVFLFFTRTQYRDFILWYEYPMRPFSLHIYKGNERMGIRMVVANNRDGDGSNDRDGGGGNSNDGGNNRDGGGVNDRDSMLDAGP